MGVSEAKVRTPLGEVAPKERMTIDKVTGYDPLRTGHGNCIDEGIENIASNILLIELQQFHLLLFAYHPGQWKSHREIMFLPPISA